MDRHASQDALTQGVAGASQPVYLTSKADIVEYYKDQYGAKWTGKAAAFVSGTTDTRSKEYRAAIRQFQGDRLTKEPTRRADIAKNNARWQGIGEKLPPIGKKPPSQGYRVSVVGKVKVSEGRKGKKGSARGDGWANAKFTRTISGPEAQMLSNNPDYMTIFSEYFDNFSHNPVTDYTIDYVSIEPAG